ncbi:MAG: host attachment protein [Chthoniobacterales bacterium]
MTPTSLIVIADRGSLKAYKVNATPTRGPSLQLVQAFDVTDAHGRYQDKVSDFAGGFPVGDGAGRHANSVAEKMGVETEIERRIFKQLADNIAQLVQKQGKEGWSFAAPAAIHSAIVALLPGDVRNRIVEHVKADLVKLELAALPGHFRSLQPI